LTRRQGTPRRLEGKRPGARRCAGPAARAPGGPGARRIRPARAAPHPPLARTGPRRGVAPQLCIGRDAGTEPWLGRSALPDASLHAALRRRAHLQTGVGQPRTTCVVSGQARPHTRLSADNTKHPPRKTRRKSALGIRASLDNRAPHTGSAQDSAWLYASPSISRSAKSFVLPVARLLAMNCSRPM
jgi:hypothetical protein